MLTQAAVVLTLVAAVSAADLPSKKYLNLAAIKTMVAAAEAKAQALHVEVTICIVDESGNLLFLEKADGAPLNTIQWAQKKARHAAFYVRARVEERFLSGDPVYREYMQRVRWRFVPYVH